jgi:hypothetical protein
LLGKLKHALPLMLSKTTVKLNKTICDRARRAAEAAGYSSLEEFIEHAVEKELPDHEQPASKEELARKLKGLGYLK